MVFVFIIVTFLFIFVTFIYHFYPFFSYSLHFYPLFSTFSPLLPTFSSPQHARLLPYEDDPSSNPLFQPLSSEFSFLRFIWTVRSDEDVWGTEEQVLSLALETETLFKEMPLNVEGSEGAGVDENDGENGTEK